MISQPAKDPKMACFPLHITYLLELLPGKVKSLLTGKVTSKRETCNLHKIRSYSFTRASK